MWSQMAWAQDAAAKTPSVLEQMLPFVAIFAIFYFFIIRPQSKRQKLHKDFVTQLKRGDSVVTSSGIFGTVEGLTDQFITLEVSDGVRMRVLRSHIASSAADTTQSANA
jgi:preprotein translocase subunit YajC